MQIGDQIRAWRKGRGWTAAKLGELLGVTEAAVTAWERGERSPSGRRMLALSALGAFEAYGVSRGTH